jgi:hypothetical protein
LAKSTSGIRRGIEARDLVNLVAAEMGRADQPAVEIVGPGMVGAGEQPEAAAGPIDQGMAAVTAGVLERPHLARLVAHQNERMARHRHDIAGIGDFMAAPDVKPGPRQPALVFEREEAAIGVSRRRQAAKKAVFAPHPRQSLAIHEISEIAETRTFDCHGHGMILLPADDR